MKIEDEIRKSADADEMARFILNFCTAFNSVDCLGRCDDCEKKIKDILKREVPCV